MVGEIRDWDALGFEFEPDDEGIVAAIQAWLDTEEADAYRDGEEDRRHLDPKLHTSE
jgi:hypothetical protein